MPSLRHRCTVAAPSLHHHCTITAPSWRRGTRYDGAEKGPSLHHHCAITAPSLHHHCFMGQIYDAADCVPSPPHHCTTTTPRSGCSHYRCNIQERRLAVCWHWWQKTLTKHIHAPRHSLLQTVTLIIVRYLVQINQQCMQ